MLTIDHIDVFYGALQVIWDVSFEVREKEILVLAGANGAGKSTIIRAISSLVTPANGSVRFNGLRLDRCPAHDIIRQGIIHVPEGRRLFLEMTVEENLVMGSLYGESKTRRSDTLEYVYSLFPRLKERRKQAAGTLSGGEQQMTAIGRGLMSLPKLMMLDEPSLGLAPILVRTIFQMIRKIRRQGVTILLVEQNVVQSLGICDRAYILENGRIIQEGTGSQLMADERVKKAILGI